MPSLTLTWNMQRCNSAINECSTCKRFLNKIYSVECVVEFSCFKRIRKEMFKHMYMKCRRYAYLFLRQIYLHEIEKIYMNSWYTFELATFTLRMLLVFFRTSKPDTGYCCRFPTITFTFRHMAQTISMYHEPKSVTLSHRWGRKILQNPPPYCLDTLRREQSFLETVNLSHRSENCRPGTRREKIEEIRELFQNYVSFSIRSDACMVFLFFNGASRSARLSRFISVQAAISSSLALRW